MDLATKIRNRIFLSQILSLILFKILETEFAMNFVTKTRDGVFPSQISFLIFLSQIKYILI